MFENYNRPKNEQFARIIQNKYGEVMLPHTFVHWTYEVTGGLIMIVDIQGWALDKE